MTSPTTAKDVILRASQKEGELGVWKTQWQDIADFIQPRKANIMVKREFPDQQTQAQLFTTTAVEGNQTLANGMVSLMVPVETPWYAFDAPSYLSSNDEAKAYYSQCTEIIREAMSNSNFYTEVHEMFLDRGGFGTSAMHVEEGKRSIFNFTNIGIGTYAISENDEGYVDCFWRWMPMTVRQAVQKFGKDNLSPQTVKDWESDQPTDKEKKITIIHEIMPRQPGEYEEGKLGPENMPIASRYVEKEASHLIEEGGYREMPTMVSRYLKWGDGFVYGYCPSFMALPEARQLNFLEKMMDALAEKAAFPPMIAPASMEGVTTIDVRANGVTYVDAGEEQQLKEWQETGRYDIGKDRVMLKQDAINRAYHVDLFRMFSDYEGPQMTAYEASLKQNEKLIQFSPTNTRLTTEFFNPLLIRIWKMALRAGILPPPPESIVQTDPNLGGQYLEDPEITYTSRIALAIKALETDGVIRTFQMLEPMAINLGKPELFDYFNFDELVPDVARNNGIPQRFLYSDDEVAQIRQSRADAAEKAQQLATQAQTASTLKDASQAQSMAQAA